MYSIKCSIFVSTRLYAAFLERPGRSQKIRSCGMNRYSLLEIGVDVALRLKRDRYERIRML